VGWHSEISDRHNTTVGWHSEISDRHNTTVGWHSEISDSHSLKNLLLFLKQMNIIVKAKTLKSCAKPTYFGSFCVVL
jgi:hypothetical protein